MKLDQMKLDDGVRSTVVERTTHMRMNAGSSPTGVDHCEELI